MSNVITSPNMNLPVPVVSVDPGPDWASNINACLSAIDSHNHTAGRGVLINPDGISINSDLPFNNNNATMVRTVNFNSQISALPATAPDLGCIYVAGPELYYNDESGNQVQITSMGSVNAGAGSISGLPSGTASASFAAGAFTWHSATNTPATMIVGPLVIGAQIASPETVTLGVPNTLGTSYNVNFPNAIPPAANQILLSDSSGNLSWSTLKSGTFSPTITATHVSGPVLSFTSFTPDFFYQQIGNIVSVSGTISFGNTGFSGVTPSIYYFASTLPVGSASGNAAGTYVATDTAGLGSSGTIGGAAQMNFPYMSFTSNGNTDIFSFNYMYTM